MQAGIDYFGPQPPLTLGQEVHGDYFDPMMGDVHLKKGRKYSHCVGCGGQIHDQYILRVAPNLEWHAACLKCCECQMFLDENCTCFVRDGKTYCKKDYVRLFGTKCDKCLRSFGKNDFVMRAKNKIFHLECFRCVACEKQLVPGDEFALRDDGLFCREDHQESDPHHPHHNLHHHHHHHRKDSIENNNTILHHNTSNSSEDNSEAPCDLSDEDMSLIGDGELSSSSSSKKGPGGVMAGGGGPGGSGSLSGKKANDRKSARARTVLSEKQLNILKTCYSANPRPDALMKEQLVEMTGLSPRVIRVWFQNKRCKDKKIQNRLMEKQIQRESDGRKLGYGGMNGIPMVATSPVRHHNSPVMNPVEIHSYEPPWKALTDFALHTDLDRLNNGPPPPVGGQFQHLVNQMHGYPDMPPGDHPAAMPPPPPHGDYGGPESGGPGGLIPVTPQDAPGYPSPPGVGFHPGAGPGSGNNGLPPPPSVVESTTSTSPPPLMSSSEAAVSAAAV